MSINGYSAAEAYFQGEHLDVPYIPSEEVRGSMKVIQPNIFGTREQTPSLYDLNVFVDEVLTKKVDDYVMMGFAGHGVGSRYMHYYAVSDHLAIFFQLSYGNTGSEGEAIRDRIDGIFYSAELLFESMADADKEMLAEKGDRLLVIESDIMNRHEWGWVKGTSGVIDKESWHTSLKPVFLEAMNDIPFKKIEPGSENPDLLLD